MSAAAWREEARSRRPEGTPISSKNKRSAFAGLLFFVRGGSRNKVSAEQVRGRAHRMCAAANEGGSKTGDRMSTVGEDSHQLQNGKRSAGTAGLIEIY
ncbi:hypothetical protein B4O97_01275 [Marispirochaeta aestuarii]|uniref:Uncharacterized protein n=1 Tax=Marispirochaeta aestuarii TaxID=1963862 RepID=A0A1Y1S355_9SPIO|nr:hypothetical protein B4O97_01275 [Marispirochaeta aestuarii]